MSVTGIGVRIVSFNSPKDTDHALFFALMILLLIVQIVGLFLGAVERIG